jgi:hypothetical protein
MVAHWVKKLTEDAFGKSSMEVGKTVMHPKGYKVKIVDGQLWGEHGFSNFWTWRRVLPGGKLGRRVSGYGW